MNYLTSMQRLLAGFYNYFSIGLLVRTLADPWRHDAVAISRLPVRYWSQAILSNTVSRFVGIILRGVVIITGFIVMIGYAILAGIFIALWYFIPLILAGSFIYGFVLLFGGLSG